MLHDVLSVDRGETGIGSCDVEKSSGQPVDNHVMFKQLTKFLAEKLRLHAELEMCKGVISGN